MKKYFIILFVYLFISGCCLFTGQPDYVFDLSLDIRDSTRKVSIFKNRFNIDSLKLIDTRDTTNINFKKDNNIIVFDYKNLIYNNKNRPFGSEQTVVILLKYNKLNTDTLTLTASIAKAKCSRYNVNIKINYFGVNYIDDYGFFRLIKKN